ncbi:MAG: conserved phage C-terminal domain-containing protein, partial [Thermodesulfobacteriota bacterium]
MKTSIPFQEIIDDLNKKSGKKYKATSKANQDLIKARWEDGYVLEDFYQLHTNMTVKWKKDARFNQYLRPETLYRRSHFEGYLNAMPIQNITHGMAETLADLEGEPVRKDHPLMSARIR